MIKFTVFRGFSVYIKNCSKKQKMTFFKLQTKQYLDYKKCTFKTLGPVFPLENVYTDKTNNNNTHHCNCSRFLIEIL